MRLCWRRLHRRRTVSVLVRLHLVSSELWWSCDSRMPVETVRHDHPLE